MVFIHDNINFCVTISNCNYHYKLFNMLAALAQMVECLPLVQQVRGSIPGGVVNFNLKFFNLWARRGGVVCMLRRHIVLLIAIRPSDGDVKPGGPLDAF